MKDIDHEFQKVECSYCSAAVGAPCRTRSGRFTEISHKARRDLYSEYLRIGRVEASPIETWIV